MKHLIDRLEIAQGNNNADELIPEAIAMHTGSGLTRLKIVR